MAKYIPSITHWLSINAKAMCIFCCPTFGINRHHDALVTKATGGVCDEVGIANRSRVQRDLVGTSRQNRADVVLGAEPAADREGDEHLIGSALNQIDNGVALFVRGGDIEEYQLVSTLPSYRDANSTGSPASRRPTKFTPFTTRPRSTSRQGITRIIGTHSRGS